MNKRGAEDLMWVVMLTLIVITASSLIIFWVNTNASGTLIKSQVNVKQAAMIIDSSQPGTSIFMNKSVSLLGNSIISQSEDIEETPSTYSHFNPNKVALKQSAGGVEISITK